LRTALRIEEAILGRLRLKGSTEGENDNEGERRKEGGVFYCVLVGKEPSFFTGCIECTDVKVADDTRCRFDDRT